MKLEEAIEKLEKQIKNDIALDYLIMLCLAKEIKEINKEISIYGIGFMNTMWGKSKELGIAVIELKIEILRAIFKIKESK